MTASRPSARTHMCDGLNFNPTAGNLPSDAEEDDIPILDPVVATFDAKLARGAQRFHRPGGHELIDRGDLSADEVLLEIGVDLGRGHGRGRVLLARPGADLRL